MALPYRGEFGAPRPSALDALALPPAAMPSRRGLRPLKAWRYIGVFAPELMACIAQVRVGPARQSFWAVWDRGAGRLHERTALGSPEVTLAAGQARVQAAQLRLDIALHETAGIETVCPSGDAYAWTRKQGGIPATVALAVGGGPARRIAARAIVDDTSAYYARRTSWRWCAGVGTATDGRALAWNLVAGVNDPPHDSERTIWVDGVPTEPPAANFAANLSAVDGLRFTAEAVRERNENRLLVRSRYRQPFGTFSGELPGAIALASGFGVMEQHDAVW